MNIMEKRKDNEQFKLIFRDEYFPEGSILNTPDKDILLKVIFRPKVHYSKWYWKILIYITFKLFFNIKCTHVVEVIDCSLKV